MLIDSINFSIFLIKKEIAEYQYADPAEALTLKLDAYQELKTQAPMAEQVAAFAAATERNENDGIDTTLKMMNWSGSGGDTEAEILFLSSLY